MSRNAVESGRYFYVTLDKDVVGGQVVVVGALIGVAETSGTIGETIACDRLGVRWLPKVTGAVNKGDKAYLKADEPRITKTATGNTHIGCFYESAASSDPEAMVLLNVGCSV